MSRTVFGNVKNADGTVPDQPVKWELQELIVTEDGIVLPGTYDADLDVAGDFSITLPTPLSGSALWAYTYPSGYGYSVQLETGPSVDIATIQTIEEADVAQNALQDLMDQAKKLTTTFVTTTYTLLDTDELVLGSGTWPLTLFAADGGEVPYAIGNAGSGNITITPAGTDTLNGSTASRILYPGCLAMLYSRVAGQWLLFGG